MQGKLVSWVPGVIFAAVAIATGVLPLFLPETVNRPLPETIKEVESWSRSLKLPSPPPSAAAAADRGSDDVKKDRDDSTKL